MARDIGLLCYEQGFKVTWVTSEERVSELQSFVHKRIQRASSIMDIESDQRLYTVVVLEHDTPVPSSLLIESSVEDLTVKQDRLRLVRPRLSPDTLILSNSSSILPSEIAPDVIGMHFFYPSALTRFAELILPNEMNETKKLRVIEFTKALKLHVLIETSSNAFIANRLLLPLLAESVRLFMNGYDQATLDKAAVLPFVAVGQFSMADEIGIDVLLSGLRRYVARMPVTAQPDYADLISTLSAWRDMGILGKKNKQLLKKISADELRSASARCVTPSRRETESCDASPTVDTALNLNRHFLNLFFNTCLSFIERGECDLSSLSAIVSSAFGAESALDKLMVQIDKEEIRTSLTALHEQTGISYFRPSLLLDETVAFK
jgi:3-hydroxyacyl-CoA dehydrogenase